MRYDKFNNILTSSKLATSLFIGSGLYHTYSDYKQSDAKYKNNFLIKDTFVLGGASLGMFLFHNSSLYLSKLRPVQKRIEKMSQKILEHENVTKYTNKYKSQIENTKLVLQNTISNFGLFASGIIGAITTDIVLNKLGLKQPELEEENKIEIFEQPRFITNFDKIINHYIGKNEKEIIENRISDMPQLQVLTPTIIGATAIELSKEKHTKDKLKQTTTCLINNSLVPMFILSLSSFLTRNLKPLVKIPIIFTSLVVGTTMINKIHKFILNNKQDN